MVFIVSSMLPPVHPRRGPLALALVAFLKQSAVKGRTHFFRSKLCTWYSVQVLATWYGTGTTPILVQFQTEHARGVRMVFKKLHPFTFHQTDDDASFPSCFMAVVVVPIQALAYITNEKKRTLIRDDEIDK
jgi:hypothetical protein